MPARFFSFLVLCWCLLQTGCGGKGEVPVTGQLTWGGEPYQPKKEEHVLVVFVELTEGGQAGSRSFPAAVTSDGAFQIDGPNRRGIPPGKYRVAVSSTNPADPDLKDRFKEAYSRDKSPFVFDVNSGNRNIKLELKK